MRIIGFLVRGIASLYRAIVGQRKEKTPCVRVRVTRPDGTQEDKVIPLTPDSAIDGMGLEEFLGIKDGGRFMVLPHKE